MQNAKDIVSNYVDLAVFTMPQTTATLRERARLERLKNKQRQRERSLKRQQRRYERSQREIDAVLGSPPPDATAADAPVHKP